MKRILVTGGAGLVGSHLCEELLARGETVLCLDQGGSDETQNLLHLFGNRRFEYIWPQNPPLGLLRVDEIYHLACPGPARMEPARILELRRQEAKDMLTLAGRTQARLLVASTREAWTEPGQRAALDAGQAPLEALLLQEAGKQQLCLKLARVFNPYGPQRRVAGNCLLSRFILLALQDLPIVLDPQGAETCSLCFVNDLVAGLIQFMADPGPDSGPIDFGSALQLPLAELAQRVIQQTGSRSQLILPARPEESPQGLRPNPHPASAVLGWEPRTELKDGLQWTIDAIRWLRDNAS